MAEPILMIALSPTMEQGTIVKWNKKEGDTINSGDIICEVETDKATMEYECLEEGILLKILIEEGKKAAVAQPIAVIGEKGENIQDLLNDLLTSTVVASVSNIPAKNQKTPQYEDENKNKTPVLENTPKHQVVGMQHTQGVEGMVKASPLAKKIAKQHNLELAGISGTGPGGRIIKRDIEGVLAKGVLPVSSVGGYMSSPTLLQDEVIAVSGVRKIIAERLSESKYSAPHYYLRLSITMDNLIKERKVLNKSLNTSISMNAFLMKFVAEAIKRHPMINTTWQGDTILKHGSIDIGLAVALPDGLITPIVRNCGSKGIINIHNELRVLIDKAQTNKLAPEEYNGATFTISNLGTFGIEEFTAIVNPPGSAILAVGTITKVPVVNENDELVIESIMKVTLSSDHRVIDGAVGAAFLKDLKNMFECPIRALY